jgi:hypothetical protein
LGDVTGENNTCGLKTCIQKKSVGGFGGTGGTARIGGEGGEGEGPQLEMDPYQRYRIGNISGEYHLHY